MENGRDARDLRDRSYVSWFSPDVFERNGLRVREIILEFVLVANAATGGAQTIVRCDIPAVDDERISDVVRLNHRAAVSYLERAVALAEGEKPSATDEAMTLAHRIARDHLFRALALAEVNGR
jgi:hypothetical protein